MKPENPRTAVNYRCARRYGVCFARAQPVYNAPVVARLVVLDTKILEKIDFLFSPTQPLVAYLLWPLLRCGTRYLPGVFTMTCPSMTNIEAEV